MFLDIFVEGGSDIPVIKEILTRKFHLRESLDFCIHPHKGKGSLPDPLFKRPDPKNLTLLHQLPAKIKGYAHSGRDICLVIVVDADRDNCLDLKNSLVSILKGIESRPRCVLFRIAVEEIESWFIADLKAVKRAYSSCKISKLECTPPDAVVGAWEILAESLGKDPTLCSGADKMEWAIHISPHLNLDEPISPSLHMFIDGIGRVLAGGGGSRTH
jgi:hypothetical protein